MENQVKEINLPDWFKGELYLEGGTVTNPYSGESCYLSPKELSMYDFIKGAEMLLKNKVKIPNLSRDFYEGLWWFKDNSIKNYMTLLD
jgi:hypothetical protein